MLFWYYKIDLKIFLIFKLLMAKLRTYIGMLEMNSPDKITTSSGKGLFSTNRTYASPKWDGTRCPEQ